jgi:homospermidine synthase
MMNEIVSGRDELGVLLMGHKKGAYWYGSDLTIDEARRVAPNNNATSLQVCTSVLAGTIWAIKNPRRGLIEPEEMDDHAAVIEYAAPYLGNLGGHYNETWTPLARREILFPEKQLDRSDPWQFSNFRV